MAVGALDHDVGEGAERGLRPAADDDPRARLRPDTTDLTAEAIERGRASGHVAPVNPVPASGPRRDGRGRGTMTPMAGPDTFFTAERRPDGTEWFRPTDHARGPWDPDACHGGPPTGLLVRALEQALPDAPGPHLRRPRSTGADGRLHDRDRGGPGRSGHGQHHGDDRRRRRPGAGVGHRHARRRGAGAALRGTPRQRRGRRRRGWPTPSRASSRSARSRTAGPASARRSRSATRPAGPPARARRRSGCGSVPLLPEEVMTPFQRISPLADCGNAFSRHAEPWEVQFVNTDLVIALHRDPVGEWMGSRVSVGVAADGCRAGRRPAVRRRGPGRAGAADPAAAAGAVVTRAARRRSPTIVGPDHVLDDPDVTSSFATDWTGRFTRRGAPRGPARVDRRGRRRAGVVPRRRRRPSCPRAATPASSAAACRGASRWSCCRRRACRRVGDVDLGAAQVTLGAGVTLAEWRRHAREAGLDAPVDFASRDSATVGGAVATNAGGSRVVRFGTMRAQVAGLTAVLADGSLHRLARRTAQGDRRRALAVTARRQRGDARRRHGRCA